MKQIDKWTTASNDLCQALAIYLRINNKTLKDLAKELNMSYYALQKIFDKNIKMSMTYTFFKKVAQHIGAYSIMPYEISKYQIN